ncbi:putative alpha-1,3-mannosyltransferase [Aspergillus uvarum CBS 121591]|uniref:Putative alpha-1,3-mannosyltransferase n=1 Tax=Aspergillus uvarum CBS 121591 TaxID=1448315 RepID=A0A319BVS8_9EURO|nr:putative alpha-1,3-mannosyltransferase [Aspergillus uvarum CBS 121591]PYH76744.1 putative alpha-1,3-mannosyltransferase [Aspergillus uvarum CBS 121591]
MTEPIQETGDAKIREVGTRARVFKAFFEAWEALHLKPTSSSTRGPTFVREDTLAYLQHHREAVAARLAMDPARVIHAYEEARTFLSQLSTALFGWTQPYFGPLINLHAEFATGGRGLVFTAGNGQAVYLLTSIQSLRRLGCTLPVEVLYLGAEDLGAEYRKQLEAIPGVVTRDLRPMIDDEGWTLHGWAAKAFAMLLSSFREVILVDADSLFFTNPAALLEDPAYRRTGALFFYDRVFQPTMERKAWLKNVLPAPVSQAVRKNRFWTGESSNMQESGVVVVDKWRHFSAMLLVTRLNGPDRDGNKDEGRPGIYDMVLGDKETFWLSWELIGDTEYAFHEGSVATMGPMEVAEKDAAQYTVCGAQVLHLDGGRRPLWFNGWLFPKISGDRHPVRFESFITEPPDVAGDGHYDIRPSNVFCLHSNQISNFTDAEKAMLNETIQLAAGLGAFGKD